MLSERAGESWEDRYWRGVLKKPPKDEWSCFMPFWIDTEAYSDRDREMFTCGVEFGSVFNALRRGDGYSGPIHTENSSRVRMMCGRIGIQAMIKQMEPPYEMWSECDIEATGKPWPPEETEGTTDH
jgi:hypothetical protein